MQTLTRAINGQVTTSWGEPFTLDTEASGDHIPNTAVINSVSGMWQDPTPHYGLYKAERLQPFQINAEPNNYLQIFSEQGINEVFPNVSGAPYVCFGVVVLNWTPAT